MNTQISPAMVEKAQYIGCLYEPISEDMCMNMHNGIIIFGLIDSTGHDTSIM